LGKIKIFSISLGVTFVLFVGLFIGHLGADIDLDVSVIRFKKVTRAGNYLWLIYSPLNFYYSPRRTTFHLIN